MTMMYQPVQNGCGGNLTGKYFIPLSKWEVCCDDKRVSFISASDELKKRKERVMQRRSEEKAHQKNLKLGKRRTTKV